MFSWPSGRCHRSPDYPQRASVGGTLVWQHVTQVCDQIASGNRAHYAIRPPIGYLTSWGLQLRAQMLDATDYSHKPQPVSRKPISTRIQARIRKPSCAVSQPLAIQIAGCPMLGIRTNRRPSLEPTVPCDPVWARYTQSFGLAGRTIAFIL